MAYTTIDDPSAHFQVKAYSGANSGSTDTLAVTFDGNSDLQPDLLMRKRRDAAGDNTVIDSNRGVTKVLYTGAYGTDAEATSGASPRLQSFDSDGFTSYGYDPYTNISGATYVGMGWKANGGTTSTNTDGVISSTVQVNSDAGFSILTYTMGSGNDTVGHGLGVAPEVVITKARFRSDANGFWSVYTTVIDGTLDYLRLNDTTTKADSSLAAPTSTVFTGAGSSTVSYRDFIAYCFTEKQGYSKFGSYRGLLGSTRPVYTGFKPAFILIKCTSAVTHWAMIDTKRIGYNDDNYRLYINLGNGENTTDTNLDIFSNGFRLLTSDSDFNNTGGTYFYMAFAENPFVTSTGIPTTAR